MNENHWGMISEDGRRRDCDVILISCYLHIYVVTNGGAVVWGVLLDYCLEINVRNQYLPTLTWDQSKVIIEIYH